MLEKFLNENIRQVLPSYDDHMIWLEDFNRHHPLWEDKQNSQLLTNTYLNAAKPLIQLIVEHRMAVALPKNIPTLQAFTTKNWTCPDNVFCTENTANSLIHCYTDPSH